MQKASASIQKKSIVTHHQAYHAKADNPAVNINTAPIVNQTIVNAKYCKDNTHPTPSNNTMMIHL